MYWQVFCQDLLVGLESLPGPSNLIIFTTLQWWLTLSFTKKKRKQIIWQLQNWMKWNGWQFGIFFHRKTQPIFYDKKQWYFATKIVLIYCEKKMFWWSRKILEIQGWRPRICKNFEITRTIYSNSERSEQFLVTECFFGI